MLKPRAFALTLAWALSCSVSGWAQTAAKNAADTVITNYISGAEAAEIEAKERAARAREAAARAPQLQAAKAAQAQAALLADFFHMLRIDNLRSVQALAAQGLDLNTPLDDPQSVNHGLSPLLFALQQESYLSAAWLAAQPTVRVDSANTKGETALMLAALRGQQEIVAALLQRQAEVNRDGFSPLHYASSGDNAAIVSVLIDAGATLDSPADSPQGNRYTPLMMAAMYGSEAVVDALLAAGADATARAKSGHTAADLARNLKRDFLLPKLTAAFASQTARNLAASQALAREQEHRGQEQSAAQSATQAPETSVPTAAQPITIPSANAPVPRSAAEPTKLQADPGPIPKIPFGPLR